MVKKTVLAQVCLLLFAGYIHGSANTDNGAMVPGDADGSPSDSNAAHPETGPSGVDNPDDAEAKDVAVEADRDKSDGETSGPTSSELVERAAPAVVSSAVEEIEKGISSRVIGEAVQPVVAGSKEKASKNAVETLVQSLQDQVRRSLSDGLGDSTAIGAAKSARETVVNDLTPKVRDTIVKIIAEDVPATFVDLMTGRVVAKAQESAAASLKDRVGRESKIAVEKAVSEVLSGRIEGSLQGAWNDEISVLIGNVVDQAVASAASSAGGKMPEELAAAARDGMDAHAAPDSSKDKISDEMIREVVEGVLEARLDAGLRDIHEAVSKKLEGKMGDIAARAVRSAAAEKTQIPMSRVVGMVDVLMRGASGQMMRESVQAAVKASEGRVPHRRDHSYDNWVSKVIGLPVVPRDHSPGDKFYSPVSEVFASETILTWLEGGWPAKTTTWTKPWINVMAQKAVDREIGQLKDNLRGRYNECRGAVESQMRRSTVHLVWEKIGGRVGKTSGGNGGRDPDGEAKKLEQGGAGAGTKDRSGGSGDVDGAASAGDTVGEVEKNCKILGEFYREMFALQAKSHLPATEAQMQARLGRIKTPVGKREYMDGVIDGLLSIYPKRMEEMLSVNRSFLEIVRDIRRGDVRANRSVFRQAKRLVRGIRECVRDAEDGAAGPCGSAASTAGMPRKTISAELHRTLVEKAQLADSKMRMYRALLEEVESAILRKDRHAVVYCTFSSIENDLGVIRRAVEDPQVAEHDPQVAEHDRGLTWEDRVARAIQANLDSLMETDLLIVEHLNITRALASFNLLICDNLEEVMELASEAEGYLDGASSAGAGGRSELASRRKDLLERCDAFLRKTPIVSFPQFD